MEWGGRPGPAGEEALGWGGKDKEAAEVRGGGRGAVRPLGTTTGLLFLLLDLSLSSSMTVLGGQGLGAVHWTPTRMIQ